MGIEILLQLRGGANVMNIKPKISYNKKKRPRGRRKRYAASRTSAYIETMVTQCIVCGIVLSLALVIRIIEIPETVSLRRRFHESISVSLDIAYEARSLGAMILVMLNQEEGHEAIAGPPTDQGGRAYEPIFESGGAESSAAGEFRIDEELLEGIMGRREETYVPGREVPLQ